MASSSSRRIAATIPPSDRRSASKSRLNRFLINCRGRGNEMVCATPSWSTHTGSVCQPVANGPIELTRGVESHRVEGGYPRPTYMPRGAPPRPARFAYSHRRSRRPLIRGRRLIGPGGRGERSDSRDEMPTNLGSGGRQWRWLLIEDAMPEKYVIFPPPDKRPAPIPRSCSDVFRLWAAVGLAIVFSLLFAIVQSLYQEFGFRRQLTPAQQALEED